MFLNAENLNQPISSLRPSFLRSVLHTCSMVRSPHLQIEFTQDRINFTNDFNASGYLKIFGRKNYCRKISEGAGSNLNEIFSMRSISITNLFPHSRLLFSCPLVNQSCSIVRIYSSLELVFLSESKGSGACTAWGRPPSTRPPSSS